MSPHGGGFGGKEGNASIFSQSAALAAHKLRRPIKLRVNRDDDMMITGKRHDFRIRYDVGYDDDGRIVAPTLSWPHVAATAPIFGPRQRPRAAAH